MGIYARDTPFEKAFWATHYAPNAPKTRRRYPRYQRARRYRRFGRRRYTKRRFSRRRTGKYGAKGKMGIWMDALHAMVYVASYKYKIMKQYARLMAKIIIQKKHNTREENKMVTSAEGGFHKGHATIPRRQFFKLINILLQKMVSCNWYMNWYESRNSGLGRDALKVLDEHHIHHYKVPDKKETNEIVEGVFGTLGLGALVGGASMFL